MLGHKDKNNKFHPHNSGKGGVREEDMKISQKGNNDTIVVEPSTKGMKGNRDSGIKLSSKAKEILAFIKSKPAGSVSQIDLDREFGDDDNWFKAFGELHNQNIIRSAGWKQEHHPDYSSGGSYLWMVNDGLLNPNPLGKLFNGEEVSSLLGIQSPKNDYNSFDHADPSKVEEIMGIPNLIDADDTQNNSPTAKKMIKLAEEYGGKLEGYWIPLASGREDARVSLTGFTLPISKEEAEALNHKLKPDEFSKEGNGYRFWWD